MPFTTEQLESYVSGQLIGREDVQCSGAEIDTRRDVLGKVFFALQGQHADGHDYIEEAVKRGCAAVVASKPVQCEVPVVIVENPQEALFNLALQRRPFVNGVVIAVTGSVGKTTTKDLIASLLGEHAISSPMSFNNELGVPMTMLDAEEASFVVIEVGANEVGEIATLASLVKPDIAVVTAIAPAHLEGFGSIEAITKEKCSLLESLTEDGVAIIGKQIDASQADIRCPIIDIDSMSFAFAQSTTGNGVIVHNSEKFEMNLLGEHNTVNGAIALLASEEALKKTGMEPNRITLLKALTTVSPPSGRMSSKELHGVTFINDAYNANPASMRALLKFAAGCESARKVLVLGDMLELGSDESAEHDKLISHISSVDADVVCLVGNAMSEACKTMPNAMCFPEATAHAMESIASLLCNDDIVFLKGSRGMALERVIECFSQRKVLHP